MKDAYYGTSAYKLDEYDKYAENTRQRQKTRMQDKRRTSLLTYKRIMIAVVVSFFICSSLIYTNVVMIRNTAKIDILNKDLADIIEKNKEKELIVNKKTNITVIEERAVNELGMQRPDNSQIVYVNINRPSYEEHPEQNHKNDVFVSLKEALMAIVEYFR